MRRTLRGSRKHVLDWVEQKDFRSQLESLIGLDACRIPSDADFAPRGSHEDSEVRLDVSGHPFCDRSVCSELRQWWLANPRKGNTPNWDLIVECNLGGRRGLVLVEAKANSSEFSSKGKSPPSRNSKAGVARAEASLQASEANHHRIGAAIEEARTAIAPQLGDVRISRDSVYQLSNRVAFAWKLATLGIPSVLLYLGFIGDKGMAGGFASAADWNALFDERATAVFPTGVPADPIAGGKAQFWIINRHWDRITPSPPRDALAAI